MLANNYFTPCEYFNQEILYWNLSDNKSPQVSRTFLSIRADLNNSVVWVASILPLISSFPSLFSRPPTTVESPSPSCSTVFWRAEIVRFCVLLPSWIHVFVYIFAFFYISFGQNYLKPYNYLQMICIK